MIRSTRSLTTTPAYTQADVQQFFDSFAKFNTEQHGAPDRLMSYRLRVIDQFAAFSTRDVVLDIGCGDGKHLFALNGRIALGIGVDLSPNMIASAIKQTRQPFSTNYHFGVDNAEYLGTVRANSIDVVFCTGALEHMINKQAVFQAIWRVLKKGGRFVCLTPNDQFFWYSKWAPALNHPTYHLATDNRINAQEAHQFLVTSGFTSHGVDYWTFIPRGDMPGLAAKTCSLLDKIGHLAAPHWLRSGLVLHGVK